MCVSVSVSLANVLIFLIYTYGFTIWGISLFLCVRLKFDARVSSVVGDREGRSAGA